MLKSRGANSKSALLVGQHVLPAPSVSHLSKNSRRASGEQIAPRRAIILHVVERTLRQASYRALSPQRSRKASEMPSCSITRSRSCPRLIESFANARYSNPGRPQVVTNPRNASTGSPWSSRAPSSLPTGGQTCITPNTAPLRCNKVVHGALRARVAGRQTLHLVHCARLNGLRRLRINGRGYGRSLAGFCCGRRGSGRGCGSYTWTLTALHRLATSCLAGARSVDRLRGKHGRESVCGAVGGGARRLGLSRCGLPAVIAGGPGPIAGQEQHTRQDQGDGEALAGRHRLAEETPA